MYSSYGLSSNYVKIPKFDNSTIESESTDDNKGKFTIKKDDKKQKYVKMMIVMIKFVCIGLICVCIMVNLVFVIKIIKIVMEKRREEEEEYKYRMVSYDLESNEKSVGVIIKDKMVRGYSFYDEEEVISGYICPLNNSPDDEEEEEYEYKLEGECNCCVECLNDDNCEENWKCSKDNICVECSNINDCSENKICNEYGKCLKSGSCGSNNDCNNRKNEYCNMNGECIKGCLDDTKCKSNEICINSQCTSIGCHSNFDCNDYNHVCIDNECIFIDDNTESCFNDDDCNGNDDYYCNYEYSICVQDFNRNVGTMVNRKNIKSAAAICSLYGVISLFVLVSSQTIITNLAKDKLKKECDQQCSDNYLMFSEGKVSKYYYSLEHKIDNWNNRDSECSGKCRVNNRLLNEKALDYAKSFCHTKTLYDVITPQQKRNFIEKDISFGIYNFVTLSIFRTKLSEYCKGFTFDYWYYYPKGGKNYQPGKTYQPGKRKFRTQKCCSPDISSIKCNVI